MHREQRNDAFAEHIAAPHTCTADGGNAFFVVLVALNDDMDAGDVPEALAALCSLPMWIQSASIVTSDKRKSMRTKSSSSSFPVQQQRECTV